MAELQGKIVPDEHIHEHATCFNVKDRGLVVITSCGHVGILNTIRQAQEVSGIKKLHGLIGGFHLGPAAPDYTDQVVTELKGIEPDVAFCSAVIARRWRSSVAFSRAAASEKPIGRWSKAARPRRRAASMCRSDGRT